MVTFQTLADKTLENTAKTATKSGLNLEGNLPKMRHSLESKTKPPYTFKKQRTSFSFQSNQPTAYLTA
jgi:hypothetical protein